MVNFRLKNKFRYFFLVGILLFLIGNWVAQKNDPYAKNTWVTPFFATELTDNGQIKLRQVREVQVLQSQFNPVLFYLQTAMKIGSNTLHAEKPFRGNEEQIIAQIHKERFDPTKAYTITGGHFSDLYMRNFGVFYAAMLDPRIPTSREDWETRQRVTLQILATDLSLLEKTQQDYTTFSPITNDTFIAANFAYPPSDSLLAVLYLLRAATDADFIPSTLPTQQPTKTYPLQTTEAGKKLLDHHEELLTDLVSHYLERIIDPQTGLIKKTIPLSGARDGIRRESSFYDNVVAWATAKYASELALPITCPNRLMHKNACDFAKWKQTIIKAFWDEEEGIFIEDLSETSIKKHIFTGEAFLAVQFGFLDTGNVEDKEKLIRMITYVRKHKLDTPLPLYYARENQPEKFSLPVRLFAPAYMGESIWSHLGQAYIQTLILLSKDNPALYEDAKKYVSNYKERIERYGGYPELYDKDGSIFSTPFYKSVLHTGWVIHYEQTKMLLGK
jgi:hypothetical protein